MSHRFKVEERPHQNKDGSTSKAKKDYFVKHTGRGGRWLLGPYTKKQAEESLESQRTTLRRAHLERHPNDLAFKRKHRIS